MGEVFMAVKALFTYDYGKENMDKIKALGYDTVIVDERNIVFAEDMRNTEVLVCYNPFSILDVSLLESLKYIQLSSIGIDQLPLDKVKGREITVCNNRGGYSIPMGEWVVMNILELMKKSASLYRNQINKVWKMNTSILELYGKTVGFIGTGSIAIESAKRLKGFGVKIFGLNTNGRNVEYFDKCFSMGRINEMLSECDAVVITIPSTKETYRLIGEDKFNIMKQGTFLINVARGNILDEQALIDNLKTGKLAGAALDVFKEEPLSQESELWGLDNVIITPHNSWISEMRNQRRWELIYNNLRRYINKEGLINIVDVNKGY
jgi:phosphoglycerate dehydrogenase-like enzyme